MQSNKITNLITISRSRISNRHSIMWYGAILNRPTRDLSANPSTGTWLKTYVHTLLCESIVVFLSWKQQCRSVVNIDGIFCHFRWFWRLNVVFWPKLRKSLNYWGIYPNITPGFGTPAWKWNGGEHYKVERISTFMRAKSLIRNTAAATLQII